MSKSLGNGIEPQVVSNKLGAEILRLWVAASDYSGDIAGDDKILARVVDAYRRIRNTLRFLLANTSDFDPKNDAVPPAQMLEIDRWALARAAAGAGRVRRHLRRGARRVRRRPLQGLRVPPGGGQAAAVLLRGPRRVLPRRAEGPPVHHGAEVAGAPLGADRAVADHARDAALDGAVPELHRRGGLGRARRHRRLDLHADLLAVRRARRRAARQVGAHPRDPRSGEQGDREPARRGPGGLVAAGDIDAARAAGRPGAAGVAGRRAEVRVHHLGRAAEGGRRAARRSDARRRPPSASAAGTTATTSAATPRTRRSAAAA